MNTQGTGQDLLATHEHVVRVRVLGIFGIGHRVEGAHGKWELVQNVEIRIVLGADQLAQELLRRGTKS